MMYSVKGKIVDGKLQLFLGNMQISELDGGTGLSADTGEIKLMANLLRNRTCISNVFRRDKLRLEFVDIDNLKAGVEIRPYFENEVLPGDHAYQKESGYNSRQEVTVFRAEVSGIYDVKAFVRIGFEFSTMPFTTGFNTSMDMKLNKNDIPYSYLAHDKGITINQQPPQQDPHIIITELDFCLNGADYVYLDCGDEICLSLHANLAYYVTEALTDYSIYGYFEAAYCGCIDGESNSSDVEFYNGN